MHPISDSRKTMKASVIDQSELNYFTVADPQLPPPHKMTMGFQMEMESVSGVGVSRSQWKPHASATVHVSLISIPPMTSAMFRFDLSVFIGAYSWPH